MQIGRKRPNEADSDLDDAQSESSDEEWEDVPHSDEVKNKRNSCVPATCTIPLNAPFASLGVCMN